MEVRGPRRRFNKNWLPAHGLGKKKQKKWRLLAPSRPEADETKGHLDRYCGGPQGFLSCRPVISQPPPGGHSKGSPTPKASLPRAANRPAGQSCAERLSGSGGGNGNGNQKGVWARARGKAIIRGHRCSFDGGGEKKNLITAMAKRTEIRHYFWAVAMAGARGFGFPRFSRPSTGRYPLKLGIRLPPLAIHGSNLLIINGTTPRSQRAAVGGGLGGKGRGKKSQKNAAKNFRPAGGHSGFSCAKVPRKSPGKKKKKNRRAPKGGAKGRNGDRGRLSRIPGREAKPC